MPAILKRYKQSPAELLDRDIDFSQWLDQHGDTYASHAVIADDGITVSSTSFTGGIVKVWLTGGTVGTAYKVLVRLTSLGGRKKEASIVVRIR